MVSLKTAGTRFDSMMHRVDGYPFRGTIEPDLEGKLIGYDYSFPRRLLRIQGDCRIQTLDVIRDVANRHYLVADHDTSFSYNVVEYRSHMLIPLTKQVPWQREITELDPLTRQPRSLGLALLEDIWILPERVAREVTDTTMRVKEESLQIFTAAELQLGDIVNKMVVKRVNVVRGVYLAEVQ